MLSTFSGLNTMVGGIQTNRLSLNTVGHNISNSKTPGYSRQTAISTATKPQKVYNLTGVQYLGTGVTVSNIVRARDIYADRQYWKESGNDGFYNSQLSNYSKLESIFNDSDDNAIQDSLEKFYKAWTNCSTTASTASSRQSVINAGYTFSETLKAAGTQLQEQMESLYENIRLSLNNINSLTDQMVTLNSQIMNAEATGTSANDLRDSRDLIVDQLSHLMDISVTENENGMYCVVSNGTTVVNGTSKITFRMSSGYSNSAYGITDYNIEIRETETLFNPGNGELQAELQAIAEDKSYVDKIANMAAFLLTTLNDQHRAGYGLDDKHPHTGTDGDGVNFYGEKDKRYIWKLETDPADSDTVLDRYLKIDGDDKKYRGMEILGMLTVNKELQETDGQKLLATRSMGNDGVVNGTADGSNAVWISTLFNCEQINTGLAKDFGGAAINDPANCKRAIGSGSLYSYYNASMTNLGADAENMKNKVSFQEDVMTQIETLRSSTSGVNWDEELSNMIMFQQGYQACSRCLTTMDEMLDKLINSTGTVGR